MWTTLAWLGAFSGAAVSAWLLVRLRRTEDRLAHLSQERDQLADARSELQIQARLQEQALIQNMIEGVAVLDSRSRIVLANAALLQIFKLTDSPDGKTLIEALRHHALQDVLRLVESSPERLVRDFEMELLEAPRRVLQVSATTLSGPQGESRGTLLVFHDLTRLKTLENTMKEFVANVSHELRTPLSLIKGYVETLIDGAKDDPAVAEKFLRTIERHTNRLSFLIDDLLTLSRLESGQIQLDFENIELLPLVEEVVRDLESKAAARKQNVQIEVPENLKVFADPERVEQVLANLIDNAIKYGREEGTIRIRSTPLSGERVEVRVINDGQGIPKDCLERVFERFYRLDKARTREQGGTGLGLSIAKRVILSHGGEIWAESEYGEGAQFCFTLSTRLKASDE